MQKKAHHRMFSGVVVSKSGEKSIIVKVDVVKMHKKYRKQYRVSQRYSVHDEKNKYAIGDKVKFIECRPLSRTKRWRVLYT
jgi:small subunit ribosomal protein S17